MCFILLLPAVTAASGATITVRKDGSGDFAVIQDALDAAASGDTIRIGPGRFDDFRPFTYPGGTPVIVANVQRPIMTLIGSGRGTTRIGREVFDGPYPNPRTLGIACITQPMAEMLTIEDLTIENVWTGLYVEGAGPFTVSNCDFAVGVNGVEGWSSYTVENCRFSDMQRGVVSRAPAQSVVLSSCRFGPMTSVGAYFQQTPSAIVEDSVFDGGDSWAVGVHFDRGGGSLLRTEINGFATGIALSWPQQPTIRDCRVIARYMCVSSNSEAFTAENNTLQAGNVESGDGAVFDLYTGGYPHVIQNNNLFKGNGLVVRINGHNGAAGYQLDMTHNWWGTTDADSIRSWIHDGNDVNWPPLNCTVDFEPFLGGPTPVEKKSLGGVKAMFR
jgi:hypothetical protein